MKRASLLVQLTLFNKRSVSAAHYHIFQPMFSPLWSLFTSLGLNNLSPPRSRFHLALARSLAPSIKTVYRWFILSNRFVPIIIIIIITEPLNILSATPSEDEENPALCKQYIEIKKLIFCKSIWVILALYMSDWMRKCAKKIN
jgi:hypothetical protein